MRKPRPVQSPAFSIRTGLQVEELTGVWAAWHGALHGAKEPTNDYAAWHRYYFWPAMERITQAIKECQGTKGHEAMVRRPVREHPGLEAFMDADCFAHPDPGEVAGRPWILRPERLVTLKTRIRNDRHW